MALSKQESPFIDNWEKLIKEPELVDLIKKTATYKVEERIEMKEVEAILCKLAC